MRILIYGDNPQLMGRVTSIIDRPNRSFCSISEHRENKHTIKEYEDLDIKVLVLVKIVPEKVILEAIGMKIRIILFMCPLIDPKLDSKDFTSITRIKDINELDLKFSEIVKDIEVNKEEQAG